MWTMSLIQHKFYMRNENDGTFKQINRRLTEKHTELFWVRSEYEKRLGLQVFWKRLRFGLAFGFSKELVVKSRG